MKQIAVFIAVFGSVFMGSSLSQTVKCSPGLNRCDWESWSTWSSCSKTCGYGSRIRSRDLCCSLKELFDDCLAGCNVTSDKLLDSTPCSSDCLSVGECQFTKADIVFVVDSSEPENFKKIKVFIQNLVNKLDIDTDMTRIGLLVFYDKARWVFKIGDFNSKTDIFKAIQSTQYLDGERVLSDALEKVRLEGFTNNRTGVPMIAVVITVEVSKYPSLTRYQASLLRKEKVQIYAIGVGDKTNTDEIYNLASMPEQKFMYEFNSYTHLNANVISLPVEVMNCTACVAKVADIVFVVDSSGSIGFENFQKIKQFIKNVIMTFDVGLNRTRVALIEYSTSAHIEFKLNEKTNQADLLKAVENITYSGGGTATSDALNLMRTEGFDRERPDAPDIVVVITDGLSKYPTITRVQANLAKNEGITMISIGIGNPTDKDELLAIASDKRYLFEVGDFEKLLTIDSVVAHLACGVILPEQHYTRISTSPVTTPSGCVDLSPDCASYPRDSCTDYEPYARKYCARTCGYCPGFPLVEPDCKDEVKNCEQYGTSMCYNPAQYDWVDFHCRKFCGFCGNKTELYVTTNPPTTQVMSTVSSCTDNLECSSYNADLCTNPTYDTWARQNCRKYCGFCYNYYHVTSTFVKQIQCPTWDLPTQCTLEYNAGQCCPFPKCPDLRLTIKRHL